MLEWDVCATSVFDPIWTISTIDVVMTMNNKDLHRTSKSSQPLSLSQRTNFVFRYSSSSRPRFSSRWWKILLWIGSIVVIAGLTLLLIGFLLPRKREQLEDSSSSDPEVIIVDRQALAYNAHLDTSHLVGVCLVLFGGVLFAASLLMPTFCHMWCANSDTHDETDPLRVRIDLKKSDLFGLFVCFS